MATRETRSSRGRRLGGELQRTLLDELRTARTVAGLSQRQVARAMGWAQAEFWRFENGLVALDVVRLAQVGAALGLDLTARFHRHQEPLRDAGQMKLIARFRAVLSESWHVMLEVPFPRLGDLRSWDVLIRLGSICRVGVEAETRIRDVQELTRRIRQRELHGGVDAIVVVLSNSAHNRQLVEQLRFALGPGYASSPRDLLGGLRAGRPLPGSGVILL